jgi:hypothetical protein
LSEAERSLLNLGLTYVPTPRPKVDIDALLDNGLWEIEEFSHRVKLADFFRNSKKNNFLPFVEKTGWAPNSKLVDPAIPDSIKAIKERVENLEFPKNHQNLSYQERLALTGLRKNNDIVIKPADKGSATVLMRKDNYIREAHRQLSNLKHYRKLDEPLWQNNCDKFNGILQEMADKKAITKKQFKYLTAKRDSNPRTFYLLPKIHKPIESWSDPMIPPGRPIISDCGSESYRISEIIDYHLQPIANRHFSFLNNTEDFLSEVSKISVPPNSLLITLDIDAMYTNIDIERGLTSVRRAFDKYPDNNRPTSEILALLELSLKGNDFEFAGEIYQQICGCAMGKRFSPSFANIYVAEWEEDALNKCPKQPLFYRRYLDDIFMIWNHSREEFDEFFTILNNHDPNIKLKANIDQSSVDFLDVTLYKGVNYNTSGLLDYKVFFKPTDSHQLLHKKSFHPPHTFKGIIKSQIIRFHRNSSDRKNFESACSTLFKALKPRGYSTRFLRKIKSETLHDLETITDKAADQKPTKIRHNRPIIGVGQSQKCGKKRCKLDLYLPNQKTFVSYQNKSKFQLQSNLDCDSKNVIYLISCKLCQKQYVGETKCPFRWRATRHLCDIRHDEDTNVAQHFNLPGHSVDRHFEIMPIEQLPLSATAEETDKQRKLRESFWIKQLKTKWPSGINVDPGLADQREIIPFSLTYNRKNVEISEILKDEYHKLQDKMKKPLNLRPVIAFKKNSNLRDILVNSKLTLQKPSE